jgi:hypothetical protein
LFHELGTSHVPPRPFLVPSVERNREAIEAAIVHAMFGGLAIRRA